VVRDAKLEAKGKADQAEGKLQNAVGGIKDTLSRHEGGPGRAGTRRAWNVGCDLLGLERGPR